MTNLYACRKSSAIGLALVLAACSTMSQATPSWDNYQGNAAHTGYVPIKLAPRNFRETWSWVSPHSADGVTSSINPVTASGGLIAVTDDDYFSPQALHVLDETSGVEVWSYEFAPDTPALNPATINNGAIYAATSGHSATFLHKFDAATGSLLWSAPFSAQWQHYLAPTVFNDMALTAGGSYGGMYSFNTADGSQFWFAGSLPQVDLFTPSVDASSAYVYTTNMLNIISRRTGSVIATIADPAPDSTCCYSQLAATIRTARARVLALSGDSFSGRASSSTGGYYSRSLVSFDLAGRTLEWRSLNKYITQPALAKGFVYAGSSLPLQLDALNEIDGQISWTWNPGDGSTQFCRNVIATNSHIFVSTDRAVHAISLKTHRSVWSIPVPGELALTDRGTLLINEGCRESTGKMVAVKLVP